MESGKSKIMPHANCSHLPKYWSHQWIWISVKVTRTDCTEIYR